ncbi:WD40/YVTN/BNR-like repeat-containing protein [Pontibacter sp. JAM-7]|uniref:WD40/YVTN/BNR-like repeat-containing protein n=1 Tax=Pontibacter sp. JAM-7 TaxID=3366581 RepID=UPI003AF7A25E
MSVNYCIDRAPVAEKASINIKKSVISVVPWAIVGALLWAGIFVKPTVAIEEVIKPAIEARDKIYGLHLIDSNNIWLCGNYGKILKSDNAGQSWVIQKSNTQQHLQDIAAWDESRAIAVGNEGVLLMTEDSGNTWIEMNVPKTEVADKLIRVHTYPEGEAWAVGEYGKILKSTDYGNSWTQAKEEEDVILNDIIKIGDDKVIVVGEFGKIFMSLDDGQSWSEIDKQIEQQNSLMAIEFANELEGLAVGLDGLMLATHDGGLSWDQPANSNGELKEHLMDVIWDRHRQVWFVVGNKGIWLEANQDFSAVTTGLFDKVDLSWHTEIEKIDNGYITVGANVGQYNPESKIFTKTGSELVR